MTQQNNDEADLQEEDTEEEGEEQKIPPVAQKVSRFGPQSGSKFGKGATNFNPPNKQRPGRAAGRGR
ncbi:hypothetical protein KBD33_03395 [Candidatus Gracilibacteria bacterium]|nr:hypothetical protein [Candidatus Gracilibacteria bacterium]